ncbi:MAG: ATP-binding protein [Armatimonadetes bacterium]|nr:ATP-binding protein [Candidatus Hippobium faecium]
MKRFAIDRLIEWKNSSEKKPLILNGARQVGKTWLMKELGEKYYKNYVYINFDRTKDLGEIFDTDLDPKRIVRQIGAFLNKEINEDTLLIFDEIQEVPKALASLKYFNEDMPGQDIICAGSLLGLALHHGISFPVGKVEHLNIYPMTFSEFLLGTDRENLYNILAQSDWQMIKVLKERYISALKEYLFVGGMPGVINAFREKSFEAAGKVQDDILYYYDMDFSKHTEYRETEKIRMIWQSLSGQLAKENKKFIYGYIREGAKAKEYESAVRWLEDCGLIHKVYRVTVSKVPLNPYKDLKIFKIFLNDVGLLSRMSGLDYFDILNKNEIFTEFKGALTEQYVCQELAAMNNLNFAYYKNDSTRTEIDFIAKAGMGIVPIEVKSGENLHAKSLNAYMKKFEPEKAVRTSLADYKVTDNLYDIPLYAISALKEIISK